MPLDQLEPVQSDRWDGPENSATRIPCWTWSMKFAVHGASDLIGKMTVDSRMPDSERDETTPPPALSWSIAGDTLTATIWLPTTSGGDRLEPPTERYQEVAESGSAWVDEVNTAIAAWRDDIAGEVRRRVEDKHEQAQRTAARIAELNALLRTGRVEELDPPREAPQPRSQPAAAPILPDFSLRYWSASALNVATIASES